VSDLPPPTDEPTPVTAPTGPPADEHGLDAAQQSLSDALGVSFTVLKVLMVVLIVVYLFSGVFQVDEQNEAVRLRFGNTVNDASGNPVQYGAGWHFGLPYPLEDVIQVPVNDQRLSVDKAFWYHVPEGAADTPALLANQPLNPLKDGFLITGDANVIHLQFDVVYRVDDVTRYVASVGDTDRATQLVQVAVERGIVIAMASADAKKVINRQTDPQVATAIRLAGEFLEDLETGIIIQDLQIQEPSPPVQIQASAYRLVSEAEQDRGTAIQNARQEAVGTLNSTAGAAHRELTAMIRAYEAADGANDDALATALQAELDRSFRDLQMAGPAVDDRVSAYLDAMTQTLDPQADADAEQALQASRDQAAAQLTQALDQAAQATREARSGRPIGGEVAERINNALSYQTQAIVRIERDFETFDAYRELFALKPALVTNDIWQASRTRVFSTGLIQTVYAPTGALRINTDSDPEVIQEIIEESLNRRRQEVEQRNQENAARPPSRR